LSALETPNTGATDMSGSGSASALLVGFTAGGGLEWLIDRRWSAKLEYLYYNLGTLSYTNSPMSSFFTGTTTTILTNTSTSSVLFDGHIINVGLNYRF
jgi:outer membrane immunogenic protein